MRYCVVASVLLGTLLTACSHNNEPAPNENVATLHQQFHGKYKIIRATSDIPVDINLDGKSSTDMVREYDYLTQSELRIDVNGPGLYRPGNIFSFYQMWPEQYVRTMAGEWAGEVIAYEKGASSGLASQGTTRRFTISPDLKTIEVQPNTDKITEQGFRWVRPESVTVEPYGMLTVVNKRRVYTSAGVKEIYVTTLYQRYTMTT